MTPEEPGNCDTRMGNIQDRRDMAVRDNIDRALYGLGGTLANGSGMNEIERRQAAQALAQIGIIL